MEWLLGLLPVLAFLLCPLMMVFCFIGMRKAGCSTGPAPASSTARVTDLSNLTPSEQLAALQAQLADLQAQQHTIAEQIERVVTGQIEPHSTEEEVTAPGAVPTALPVRN